jgi:hypothetical protein
MYMTEFTRVVFDSNGKITNDRIKNFQENEIEPYKNCLYLNSPKMWCSNTYEFMSPTIARIDFGDLCMGGFHILAHRRKLQDSIFYKVSYRVDSEVGNLVYAAGIGAGCYRDRIETTLKNHSRFESEIYDNWYEIQCCNENGDGVSKIVIENFETKEQLVYWEGSPNAIYDYSKDWIGITVELKKQFLDWLNGEIDCDMFHYDKQWFENCKQSLEEFEAKPIEQ